MLYEVITTNASLRSMRFPLLRKGNREISLRADAFLDFAADTFTVSKAILRAGRITSYNVCYTKLLRTLPSHC